MVDVPRVLRYVWNVMRHWVTLVAGVAITVAGFVASASGRPVPPAAFWAAGGVFIAIAQYLAWLDGETQIDGERIDHKQELAAASAQIAKLERTAEERFASVRYTLVLKRVDFRFVPNEAGDRIAVHPTLVFENVGSDWLLVTQITNVAETCGRRRDDFLTGSEEGIRVGPGGESAYAPLAVENVPLSDLTRHGSSFRIQYTLHYGHPAGGPLFRRDHDLNIVFQGQHALLASFNLGGHRCSYSLGAAEVDA
jgi:drug/metabolite transporter superfamily protein YnfA